MEHGPTFVRELLDAGADANETSPRLGTALQGFAKKGRLEAAAVLIQYGAAINLKNTPGHDSVAGHDFSAGLHRALRRFLLGITFLLDNGADTEMQRSGFYDVQIAAVSCAAEQQVGPVSGYVERTPGEARNMGVGRCTT